MTKKLKLDLDKLRIETFEATPETKDRKGTVVAFTGPVKCSHYATCPSSNCC
jgi:hypothetical protein